MNFYLLTALKAAVLLFLVLTTVAYLQWVERKVIAHVQVRMGPSRVGPHGLLQPLADVIKLITKEGVVPPFVNKVFYLMAPIIAVSMALISVSILPFGKQIEILGTPTWLQLADLNVGILLVLAVSSLGVYGVALAGWSSNNKYALLGALRSSAQMISYELPLSLAVAAPLLLVNTLSLREIVEAQGGFSFGVLPRWTIFQGPMPQIFSFFIFVIAGFAETNRVPFDLPEAENELVAGFHTEYSSMNFAAFFMAEYCNMVTISAITTVLFLGGWQPLLPAPLGSDFVPALVLLTVSGVCFHHGLNPVRRKDGRTLPVFGVIFLLFAAAFFWPPFRAVAVPPFWFLAKTGFLLFTFIWVRATLPRFRYDQLMNFAWKFLFPVSMANLLVTGLLVALN